MNALKSLRFGKPINLDKTKKASKTKLFNKHLKSLLTQEEHIKYETRFLPESDSDE